MTYLVKSHWKKILLSVYVVAVLVISATVRAESLSKDQAFRQELAELTAEINFLKERRLLDVKANDVSTDSMHASVQSLVGYFEVTPLQFEANAKVYFVTVPSQARFEVQLESSDLDLDRLEKRDLYQVEGFVIKQSLPSRPQFLPSLIVTSIRTQR